MGTWTNDDGLHIKFGTDEATVGRGGEFTTLGEHRVLELVFNATDLAVATDTILSDTVTIPEGFRIEKADLYVETAFTSGGAATLDLGTMDQDRTTVIDADGIDSAIAVGSLTAGATIACDGAQIDTTLADGNTALITAGAGTAVFTAGKGVLRVYIYKPATVS